MTRETKVGLVVGTGIILLIGIVVSDHLSSQQRGQQQTAAPPGYTDLANGQPRAISPQGVRPFVDAGAPAETHGALPLPPVHDANGNLVAPRRTNRDPHPNLNKVTDGGLPFADSGNVGRAAPPGVGSNIPPGPGDAGQPRALDRHLPPNVAEDLRRNNFLPEDTTPRLENQGGNTGVRPTEPLIHHVVAGETLWAIAEKFYGVGNGRYAADIAKANADKLLPNQGIREGVRLVIPNRVIVIPGPGGQGNTDPATPSTGASATLADSHATGAASTHTSTPTDTRPQMKTIKVEPGDSLSAISSRTLGSIRHMQLIIDANRDQIQDADDIKAGMTLRIPPAPAAPPVAPGNGAGRTATPPATPTLPRTPSVPTAPGASTTTIVARVHKVQPRDTFSSIARSRLGSDRRWREIFELNRDKVANPDALREGLVLVLPTDARQ